MYKPGTDENNVQMSDVLCDFCHREWTEDLPVIEGHRGSVICGRCLAVAWTEIAPAEPAAEPPADPPADPLDAMCMLCREEREDRETLGRGDEAGWHSPAYPDAAICTRCITQAADALERDPDWTWKKP